MICDIGSINGSYSVTHKSLGFPQLSTHGLGIDISICGFTWRRSIDFLLPLVLLSHWWEDSAVWDLCAARAGSDSRPDRAASEMRGVCQMRMEWPWHGALMILGTRALTTGHWPAQWSGEKTNYPGYFHRSSCLCVYWLWHWFKYVKSDTIQGVFLQWIEKWYDLCVSPGKGKVWHCSLQGWHRSRPCTAWGPSPETRTPGWGTCPCARCREESLKIQNYQENVNMFVLAILCSEKSVGCQHQYRPNTRSTISSCYLLKISQLITMRIVKNHF